ncbi:MMPL family transporter [Methanogenium cariaci]|uniref:MMPL family transporter n=1 Tax=Methanogenium cariaci TaxID=2197 RepID=UPI0007848182|nr:MMPL family transporter [Methanogenium cariaci]
MIVGWNAVIMYVLGLEYNILTATLGAMTIGVASEYTILIMERYDEERERGLSCMMPSRPVSRRSGRRLPSPG